MMKNVCLMIFKKAFLMVFVLGIFGNFCCLSIIKLQYNRYVRVVVHTYVNVTKIRIILIYLFIPRVDGEFCGKFQCSNNKFTFPFKFFYI